MAGWRIIAFNGTTGTYYDVIENAIEKFCVRNQLCRLDIKSIEQI